MAAAAVDGPLSGLPKFSKKAEWMAALEHKDGLKVSVWDDEKNQYVTRIFKAPPPVAERKTTTGFKVLYAHLDYHPATHFARNPPGRDASDHVGTFSFSGPDGKTINILVQTNPTSMFRYMFKVVGALNRAMTPAEAIAVHAVAAMMEHVVLDQFKNVMQTFFAGNMADLLAFDPITKEMVCIRGLTEPVMSGHGHGVWRVARGVKLSIDGKEVVVPDGMPEIGEEVELMKLKIAHSGDSMTRFSQHLCNAIMATKNNDMLKNFTPRK
jgi:hypothetical protein